MGGRLRTTQPSPQQPFSSEAVRVTPDRVSRPLTEVEVEISWPSSVASGQSPTKADDVPGFYPENLLEERDTGYDAMLSQMVGRIRSNPGGIPEMGGVSFLGFYLLMTTFSGSGLCG